MGKKRRRMFNPKFSLHPRSRVNTPTETTEPQNEVIVTPALTKEEPKIENVSVKEEVVAVEQIKPTIVKEEPKITTPRSSTPQPKITKQKVKKETTSAKARRTTRRSTKIKKSTKE
tara:strand:- start:751 stop:1098 length:348 start_codon:yes stop_codon:yes gene_type:complete